MIVYRDIVRSVTLDSLLARLLGLADHGRIVDFLVELGELEQAVADARHPHRDDWTGRDRLLRSAIVDAAVAMAGHRNDAAGLRGIVARVRDAVAGDREPLRVRAAEGYLHYALDPYAYRAAADAYLRKAGRPAAAAAVVVGIRSIGTSLSAVVAATLATGLSLTVRPRGQSGQRRVQATPRLEATLLEGLRNGGDVLLVDEGPGVTGETFECVAAWARDVGVPSDRIVLFPSHDASMPLAPESRRRWFRMSRRYMPPLEDRRARDIAAARGWSEPEELSAGRWRDVVDGGGALPACPHFERLKYRAKDRDGRLRLLRYAGLAAAGDDVLRRGDILSRALAGLDAPGFAPPVREAHGFVSRAWIDGRPLSMAEAEEPAFRRVFAGYLVARAGLFGTGEPVDRERWCSVLCENGAEAPGVDPDTLAAAAARLDALPEREAVLPDGRIQPHEWILGSGGYAKVDALDHGNGLRLPGPADAVWDLAGAAVELRLPPAAVQELIERIAPRLGEAPGAVAAAVLAYRPVYAAAAYGDAALSAREIGDGRDRTLLEAAAERYRALLRVEVIRSAAGARAAIALA